MNKEIDAEKLINILVGKIAELELENAKLKVLIDTEFEEQKGSSEWVMKKQSKVYAIEDSLLA